jgi:ABC-2 type transport system ATP-binding protein
MHAIETTDLTHDYGAKRAIDAVSLAVPQGSIFGFLGPNGAGKTTTIRVLLGFLHARAGGARVLGQDCWRDSRRIKQDVGYVPGDLRLWPWLTGRGALALFGRVRGQDIGAYGAQVAERLGLDLMIKVRAMSKGTRQKLGLVLAMAHRPRVLILDEPSSGLDPLVQDTFRALLREAAGEGRTVFLSSHTLGEVEDLCERVAIVRQGRIVAADTLASLRARAGHHVVLHLAPGALLDESGTPPGLTLDAPSPNRPRERTGLHSGDLAPLLAWLARQQLADVSVGRPDLEAMFRGFYGPATGQGGAR